MNQSILDSFTHDSSKSFLVKSNSHPRNGRYFLKSLWSFIAKLHFCFYLLNTEVQFYEIWTKLILNIMNSCLEFWIYEAQIGHFGKMIFAEVLGIRKSRCWFYFRTKLIPCQWKYTQSSCLLFSSLQ